MKIFANGEFLKEVPYEREGGTPHRKKSIYQFGKTGKLVRYVIKPLILKAFAFVRDNLEEPTIENTWHPNSHIIIEIRERFKERNIHNATTPKDLRARAYLGMLNLAIAVYEFDLFYRERIDWAVKKLRESDWITLSDEKEPRSQWWADDGKFDEC